MWCLQSNCDVVVSGQVVIEPRFASNQKLLIIYESIVFTRDNVVRSCGYIMDPFPIFIDVDLLMTIKKGIDFVTQVGPRT